jgi:hypothetical protein
MADPGGSSGELASVDAERTSLPALEVLGLVEAVAADVTDAAERAERWRR